ncbi:MAG: glycosyltransferase [Myxococcota bacterium]|nr:glycosyltransferase [Myxococcota bacterium]
MKYAPVMWNHARAFGQPLAGAEHEVRYLLAGSYQWMVGPERNDVDTVELPKTSNPLLSLAAFLQKGGPAQIRRSFSQNTPRLVIIVNFNQLVDRLIIREARKANPKVRIVLLIHEPHTEDKRVYGWKRSILLFFYEKFTRGLARRADALILPSPSAHETWKKYSGRIKSESKMIPLPFVDESLASQPIRTHISFVGQIAHAHQKGLDLFLEMIEAASRTHPELRFRIVTGDDTASVLSSLSQKGRKQLEVITGNPLSDKKIHEAVRSSLVVTILQRRVMQSGTLPVAMMNGTPALVTDLQGLTQFIEDHKNGRVVALNSTAEERLLVLTEMLENLPAMSLASRTCYEETFDSRNVTSHIPWLLHGKDRSDQPR